MHDVKSSSELQFFKYWRLLQGPQERSGQSIKFLHFPLLANERRPRERFHIWCFCNLNPKFPRLFCISFHLWTMWNFLSHKQDGGLYVLAKCNFPQALTQWMQARVEKISQTLARFAKFHITIYILIWVKSVRPPQVSISLIVIGTGIYWNILAQGQV